MKTNSIGFIGGGRITKIFLQGFKNKWVSFDSVKVYDPNSEILDSLKADFPDIQKATSIDDIADQVIIVVAVHPPAVMEVLKKLSPSVNEKTVVISLAPKITIEKMAAVLPTKRLVRMIPNATSFINEGFNPIAFHHEMDEKEKKQTRKLFKTLGKTFETEEEKLESYAIVSAMLPTYFWFQWLETERIGRETGLTVKEARKAVKSTLLKAIKLYYDSGLTPAEVIDLIPVKPIGNDEIEITNILDTRLMGLFGKIKP